MTSHCDVSWPQQVRGSGFPWIFVIFELNWFWYVLNGRKGWTEPSVKMYSIHVHVVFLYRRLVMYRNMLSWWFAISKLWTPDFNVKVLLTRPLLGWLNYQRTFYNLELSTAVGYSRVFPLRSSFLLPVCESMWTFFFTNEIENLEYFLLCKSFLVNRTGKKDVRILKFWKILLVHAFEIRYYKRSIFGGGIQKQ